MFLSHIQKKMTLNLAFLQENTDTYNMNSTVSTIKRSG